MTELSAFRHLKIADADRSIRHIFVRDMVLEAEIGVHVHEKNTAQTIRVNVDLSVAESAAPLADALANTVCYEAVTRDIKSIVAAGHVNLVETLAERIAAACLETQQVVAVCVRVEKLNAVPEAASVGVEIERRRL